jgi:bifunctional non-homologous end joining protein LigD
MSGAAIEIEGVRLTSPERVLYPEQGITKREMAEYYAAVAPFMLPQIEGRPLTLIRCPGGRQKECFVQRRAGPGIPRAVRRVEVEDEEGEPVTYLSAGKLSALLSLVQLGVLEFHVWNARVDRLDRPDRMMLDLDPDPELPFSATVEAALALRARLAELGLESFVKTTGGKGLHLVTPLGRRSTWEEVREFARALAEEMSRAAPELYLAESSRAARGGRIYLDYLRNGYAASAVAPYSTRARAGAPVSFPVEWSELNDSLRPADFDVRSVPALLKSRERDPWADYAAVRQSLDRGVLERVHSGRAGPDSRNEEEP